MYDEGIITPYTCGLTVNIHLLVSNKTLWFLTIPSPSWHEDMWIVNCLSLLGVHVYHMKRTWFNFILLFSITLSLSLSLSLSFSLVTLSLIHHGLVLIAMKSNKQTNHSVSLNSFSKKTYIQTPILWLHLLSMTFHLHPCYYGNQIPQTIVKQANKQIRKRKGSTKFWRQWI